jgi:hypothetical protein
VIDCHTIHQAACSSEATWDAAARFARRARDGGTVEWFGRGARRDLRVLFAEGRSLALGALAAEPAVTPEQMGGLAVNGDVTDPHVRPVVHVSRHPGAQE